MCVNAGVFGAGLHVEVDHTTDVRRNKLGLYESWGFPEVWVETPDTPSPSRPRRLRPGLTIYRLDEGRFRVSAESRVFPGWPAARIHASLNETHMSPRTLADLTRVGRRLGRQEGTTPDDDPQIGRHRRQARRTGLWAGRAEGVAAQRALLGRLASRKFSEKQVEISLGDGVTVNGRIDLVRRLDTDETTIVDLKSSDRAQAEAVTETQLHVYALGYQELTGRNPDYVEIYELDQRKRKPRSVDDEFIDDVKAKTRDAARALRLGDLPATPAPPKCRDCDYRGMCTAGRNATPAATPRTS